MIKLNCYSMPNYAFVSQMNEIKRIIKDSILNPNPKIPTPKYLKHSDGGKPYIPFCSYSDGIVIITDAFDSYILSKYWLGEEVAKELEEMASKNQKMFKIYRNTLKNLEKSKE